MPRPLRGKTSPQTVQKARRLRLELTDSERLLWTALRASRLACLKFRRQHPLGPYILDFFSVQAQLVIELDGSIHAHPDQADYDAQRTAYLEDQGLRVLRFTNEEVLNDLEQILSQIRPAASQPHPSLDCQRHHPPSSSHS